MSIVSQNVKSYLSAVRAAAIYITVCEQKPRSVGVARDLDKALTHLRGVIDLPITFGWIAWAPEFDALTNIAKHPGIMVRIRDDGVKVSRTLPELVLVIESLARRSAIVLTPHKTVVERATALAASVERVFANLRTSGHMAEFNAAYKQHRSVAQANGEGVIPYWAATERLKRVTIRALIASPSREISSQAFLQLICQEFPWFSVKALDTSRKRA